MAAVLTFIAILLGIVAADWIVSTRIAAFYVDRDYCYKYTPIRVILILIIGAFLTYVYVVNDVDNPSLLHILISLILFTIYGWVILKDVKSNLTDECS